MKILITGGLGYIASHVISLATENDIQPIIIDNCSNSDESVHGALCQILGYKIPWYKGDIGDKDLIRNICMEHDIVGVMHFAAYKAVGESCKNPFGYYDNNVWKTINMCQMLQEMKIQTILFSSSCTVYGMGPGVEPPFDETLVRSTTNPYGTTKFMNELMFEDLSKHLDWRVMLLRYFNPIGAHPNGLIGENPNGVPSNLFPYIMRVSNGTYDKLMIWGDDYDTPDGTAIRDYIHVMDLANAHIVALKHLLSQGNGYLDSFNLGTGKGTSVKDMLQMCSEVIGHEIPYEVGPRREGDVQSAYANAQKAKHVLGREAAYTVRDAVRDGRQFQKNSTLSH